MTAEARRVLLEITFGRYAGSTTTAAVVELHKLGFVTYLADGALQVTERGRIEGRRLAS